MLPFLIAVGVATTATNNPSASEPTSPLWVIAVGFALLLSFYGWLGARSSSRALLTVQPFGIPDIFCASVLALWMISVIAQSLDAHESISLKAIIANSLFYICLIMGIFGVIGFQGKSQNILFLMCSVLPF